MIFANVSRQFRFALWATFATTVASAALLPYATGTRQEPQSRKSTDPPMAAQGKFGQDLFLAINHRDLKEVKSLLKAGADPNARNGLGFRPLFMAAASHQCDVMQTLLQAGAKPNVDSTYGTALMFAAHSANLEGAQILFLKGAKVNSIRDDGMSVLMMASVSGSPEFVGELLKRKANVNALDDSGATALMYAAREGHVKVGEMLVSAGAKVDAVDDDRQTPLMVAAMAGRAQFVQMLIRNRANVNLTNAKGRSALLLAMSSGDYPEVVKALLEAGADVNVKDPNGRTAYALAVARDYKNSEAILGKASLSPGVIRSPREAVNASLKVVQSSMLKFSQMTRCVSCHQEGLGRMATGEALDRGFLLDQSVQRAQIERIGGMLNATCPLHQQALKNPEVMKQVPLIEINEVATADTWLLCGMAAQKQASTPASSAMAMVLARQQMPDGSWSFSGPRVPMQSSFITFTALSVRSLQAYAPGSAKAEVDMRIEKARAWLIKSVPQTSEDRASKLLGLKWSGAAAQQISDAQTAVLVDQRQDGGWSQLPNLNSDAYATGQALYALHVGGRLSAADPAYVRGVRFLLRTQDEDGSWFVNKRAIPSNNYFDAGFPHGQSQYASFNGTCWAIMALLATMDSGKPVARR